MTAEQSFASKAPFRTSTFVKTKKIKMKIKAIKIMIVIPAFLTGFLITTMLSGSNQSVSHICVKTERSDFLLIAKLRQHPRGA